MVMNVRATDILKAIQKLNPAEKHRLWEYLIEALTVSSSTGTGTYSMIVDGDEVTNKFMS